MIQVVIVAPLMALRTGLRAMLSGGPSPTTVIAEAARLEDLDDLPDTTDVLILTEAAASLQALRTALAAYPGQAAVLLLAEDPPSTPSLFAAYSQSDLPVRAWGALSLDAAPEELCAATWALAQGLWVGAPLFLHALRSTQYGLSDGEPALSEPLTDRELEVLQLLAQGLANKQIALALQISEHTVKFHVSAIYTKLNAANRTEAVRLGVQQGLVSL